MRHQPLFIVLEGLDGSGKSTLARSLAQCLGAEYRATPLRELQPVRAQVDRALDETPLARVLWYAAQVARASDQVRALLQAGRTVVLDRYWLSTLAYARLQGQSLLLPEVGSQLLEPDFTFYLEVPLETRAHRLASRVISQQEVLQPHDRASLDPEGARLLSDAFRDGARLAHVGRWCPLELTSEPPETVLDRALEHLEYVQKSVQHRRI